MKILFVIFLISIGLSLPAQTGSVHFKQVDNKVKSISSGNIDTLAKKLTTGFKTDAEKTRAIFKWISGNIEYDTDLYHDTTGIYKRLWSAAVMSGTSNIEADYNNRIVNRVLTTKKAICDGYSRLFKLLCDKAGVKCDVITGFIRWSSDPIGEITNRRHAWNAVLVDGSWKLIDVTWASGYCDDKVTKFTKSYDDFFFFTPPVEFFNDHYPDDPKWSLLPNTPSRYEFYNFPFYYPEFYRAKISYVKPTLGIIDIGSTNKIARIELEINILVKDFFVYESPVEPENKTDAATLDTLGGHTDFESWEPDYSITNNQLVYTHKFNNQNAKKLNIILNGKLILSYGIRLR